MFGGLVEMKKNLPIVAFIAFFVLIMVAEIAFPTHLGEPSWYHVARIDCLMAATVCGLVAIVSVYF